VQPTVTLSFIPFIFSRLTLFAPRLKILFYIVKNTAHNVKNIFPNVKNILRNWGGVFSVTGKGFFRKAGNIFRSVGWKCRTASARIMRHPHVNGVPISELLHDTIRTFACYMA